MEPKNDLLYLQKDLEKHLSKADNSAYSDEELNGGEVAKDNVTFSQSTFTEQIDSATPSIGEDYLPPAPPLRSDTSSHEEGDFQEQFLPEVSQQEDLNTPEFAPESHQEEPLIIRELNPEEGLHHFEPERHEIIQEGFEYQKHFVPEEETFGSKEQVIAEIRDETERQESFENQSQQEGFELSQHFKHRTTIEQSPNPTPLPELLHANEGIEHTDYILESPVAQMESPEDVELIDSAHMNLVEESDQFAVEKQESVPLHFTAGDGAGEALLGGFEQEAPLASRGHIPEGDRHIADAIGVVISKHPKASQQPVMMPVEPVTGEVKPSFEEIKRDLEKKK